MCYLYHKSDRSTLSTESVASRDVPCTIAAWLQPRNVFATDCNKDSPRLVVAIASLIIALEAFVHTKDGTPTYRHIDTLWIPYACSSYSHDFAQRIPDSSVVPTSQQESRVFHPAFQPGRVSSRLNTRIRESPASFV